MKTTLLGKLRLTYLNGRIWRLDNTDQTFGVIANGVRVVPADGFITDFASIPRFMWRIFPPVGDGSRARYGVAAVLHDWLYNSHLTTIDGIPISKQFSDDVFLAAMVELGVEKWKRNTMYKTVQWFGGSSWIGGPARQKQLQKDALKYL
jgi:hypothetical protein